MDYRNRRCSLLWALISALIAGCGPDMGSVSAPTQGPSQGPIPTTPTSPAPSPVNRTPTVSGTPTPAVTAGASYSFTPAATDADGDALVWSITGKPADATFSTTTGSLTWTPDQPGIWSNIRITVTDSRGASAALAPFAIEVLPAAPIGSASLSWSSPSEYTDGSSLPSSELTGFVIYSGLSASALSRIAEVDGRTTSFVVGNLPAGTHYFAVTAIASSGAESAFSSIGQKTISTL